MREGDRISLCIIARDEEHNLRRCLASVSGSVDEVVVLDTGSRDGTAAVAESFGARVVHARWTNDFAAARNLSIEQATGTWILWLDADDELSAEARAAIRPLVRLAPPQVMGYQFVIVNWVGEKPGGGVMRISQTRLWRNRTQHRFHGAIHEWLHVESVVATQLAIYHHGYLSDRGLQRRKSARNIGLLQAQLKANPDDARYIGYLAVEYAVAGRLPQSLRYFRRSWALAKIHYVGERYARTLINLRRYEAARGVLEEAIERFPEYTDLYYHYSCVLRELGEYRAARTAARRCLELGTPPGGYVSLEGYGSFLAHLQLARIEADLHNWAAAIAACLQALAARADLTLALPLLVEALVASLGASAALRTLTDRDDLGPATRRLLAREFARRHAWAEAAELLRQAGTEGELPGDLLLRAECLLALGESDAAVRELEALRLGEFALNASRRQRAVVLRCLCAWMLADAGALAAALHAAQRGCPGAVAGLRCLQQQLTGSPVSPPSAPAAKLVLLELAEATLLAGRRDLTDAVAALLQGAGDRVLVPGVLGRLLLRHGHPEAAKPHLRQAVANWGRRSRPLPVCGGDHRDLWLDLGDACLATGEWGAAAKAFARADAVHAHGLRPHLGLAEAYLRMAVAFLPAAERPAWAELAQASRRERLAERPVGGLVTPAPQVEYDAVDHRPRSTRRERGNRT